VSHSSVENHSGKASQEFEEIQCELASRYGIETHERESEPFQIRNPRKQSVFILLVISHCHTQEEKCDIGSKAS